MKKVLSVILALIMALSAFSVMAFAEEKPFYLVLGDSIAHGSGLMNANQAVYGKVVADTNGYDYSNEAIPGHRSENLIARLGENKIIELVKKADIISISIGGNDFLTSNLMGLMYQAIVKEDLSEFDEIRESFRVNFARIISIIKGANPDVTILAQSLYNPQFGNLREAYQEAINRVNEVIYGYESEHPGEIVIVDVASAIDGDPKNFAGDGIHPSVKGNALIARAVLAKLAEIGLGTETEPVVNAQGIDTPGVITFSLFYRIMGGFLKIIATLKKALG